MGDQDVYGKAVMRRAAESAFCDYGPAVQVTYGTTRGGATIDGVVGSSIAVEVESRVPKQIRGAVLDLICHRYPKKLLVLVPVHMSNPALCSDQCRHILGRFLKPEDYRVVLLSGSGFGHKLEHDADLVRAALRELGFDGTAEMKQSKFPPGWDQKRVQRVLKHYEQQTEEEALAEDEAAYKDSTQAIMKVPRELVPSIRELIAKHKRTRRA